MQFIFTGKDKPNSNATRIKNRPKHAEHLKKCNKLGVNLLLAGPVLDDSGKMCCSVLIIKCESIEIAKKFCEIDLYSKANLFEEFSVKPYEIVINNFI